MDFFDILLAKKLEGGGGGDVTIEQLDVTENGTYSEPGKAYRPVIVNLPLDEKTITANGTYNASADNLQGFNKVVVNVAGYKLKAMTPGAIASFNDGQALPLTKLLIDIKPVQAGSGDPSPVNNRPISGWIAANINVTGANVWNEEWELGTINVSNGSEVPDDTRIRNKGFIAIKPNTTYHFVVPVDDGRIVFYDKNKNYLMQLPGSTIFTNKEFTTPNNAYYVRFSTIPAYGITYNNDISINYPTTDTSYHAHDVNAKIINIEFKDGTNPLIVYGATLDVINGVLTVNRIMVDLGTLNWRYSSQSLQFFVEYQDFTLKPAAPATTADKANILCSNYKNVARADLINETICINPSGNLIVLDNNYTDAATFKTAMDGVQLVYELETPQTYQLTPTQINSLLGVNNIFADTGNILEGEYFAAL